MTKELKIYKKEMKDGKENMVLVKTEIIPYAEEPEITTLEELIKALKQKGVI